MKLFAKKSLGQHFLASTHVLGQIIGAAALKDKEQVLEIGPGTGVLTHELLAAGAVVTAVEKDARAIDQLQQEFATYTEQGMFRLIPGDILEQELITKLSAQFSAEKNTSGSFALVANIPYYITGAILEQFLEHGPRPDRMVLLVQKEVAERIIARDGKESILSVSVKAFGEPKLVAKVPPGAFVPPPSVDSAILSVSNITDKKFTEQNISTDAFFKLVKAGFAHKRKFALRNVEAVWTDTVSLQQAWQEVGLSPNVRAEDMSVGQWFDLTAKFSQK